MRKGEILRLYSIVYVIYMIFRAQTLSKLYRYVKKFIVTLVRHLHVLL